MYEPGSIHVANETECIYDTETEDMDRVRPGTAYLPHSCEQWIIGGEDHVRRMIADLQEVLAHMEEVNYFK